MTNTQLNTKHAGHCDLDSAFGGFVQVGDRRQMRAVSQNLHEQQQVRIMSGRKLLYSQCSHVAPLEPAASLAAKQINQ